MGRLLIFAFLISFALNAAEYTFVKIADSGPGSQFDRFDGALIINNRGSVAFKARLRDGFDAIFTGNGTSAPVTVFRETPEIQDPFVTDMNDSGTMVFMAGGSLYSTTGGTPALVFETSATDSLNRNSAPSINNSGTVAWDTIARVYTRTGAEPARVLVQDTDIPRAIGNTPPRITGARINSSGTVVFAAMLVGNGSQCSCGLFTKGTGSLTPIVSVVTQSPPLNDSGGVAFAGDFDGKHGIFVGRGGPIAAAVELPTTVTLSPFHVWINNKEQVLFLAAGGGLSGLFTGPDLARDKVITLGDPLFGSTVTRLDILPIGNRLLNDNGQVVFTYTLSNLVSGIAVATPVAVVGPPRPIVPDGSILNGASFSADGGVSPGAAVAVFGFNFATRLTVASTAVLPVSLDDARVLVNGAPAPLFFVAPGQLSAQVPYEISGTSATFQVTNPQGQSEIRTVAVASQTPAIYSVNQQGFGQGVVVFANTETLVANPGVTPDSRPARAGDVITIYANGLGRVEPAIASGFNSCDGGVCAPDFSNLRLRHAVVRPVVEIGGVRVPDDQILFAGLVPQYVGLYQINLRVPAGVRSGQTPIVIRQGNAASRVDVTIAVL